MRPRGTTRYQTVSMVVLAVAILSGCASEPTIVPGDVESAIVRGLSDQVGGRFTARCPSPIPAQSGLVATCTVLDETGGAEAQVEVVQTDSEGSFRWRVTSVASDGPSPSASGSGT